MSVSAAEVPVSLDALCDEARGEAWIVIHVRPKCEKKTVYICNEKQISTYMPTLRTTHTYGQRRRSFDKPLFSGYIFAVVNAQQWQYLRQNNYVANILEVTNQSKFVSQLSQIQKALSIGAVVEIQTFLEKGTRVRVTAGPFKGVEGVVCHVKGGARVIINIDMIQQSVAFEVDAALLEVG